MLQTKQRIKSPLKWAGGKSFLIPKLEKIWNQQLSHNHNLIWVDLFAGGLSLPLALQPKQAIINDINKHLIEFWLLIKQDGVMINLGFENSETYYYELRDLFNCNPLPERFYYLNRTCFNGLCRYNKKGEFNVPFGKYQRVEYQRDFTQIQSVIKDWQFSSRCFSDYFKHNELLSNHFVFCDPPYDSLDDNGFTNYSADGFDWNDQVSLAQRLASHDGIAIATNKATKRIIRLYTSLGFNIELIEMPRRIAANGDRKPVIEMFATRNLK